LWKSNKKDDCFEVYLDSCLAVQSRLLTEELLKPLRDTMEHGKAQGALNKQRGAVVLRKALDKFLADTAQAQGGLRSTEESAATSRRAQQTASREEQSAATKASTEALVLQLETIDSNHPPVEISPRATGLGGGGGGEPASALLLRARAAEQQVQSLKKQLAAIINATAASSSSSAVAGVGAGEGDAPTASASSGTALATGTAGGTLQRPTTTARGRTAVGGTATGEPPFSDLVLAVFFKLLLQLTLDNCVD
jgi:hypothetical protein